MTLSVDSIPPPDPPGSGLDGRRVDWSARDVVVGVLWFIALFVSGQIVLVPPVIIWGDMASQLYVTAFVFGAIVEVGIVVVAANLSFRRYGGGWERLGIRPPTSQALLWALGAFVAAFGVSLIYGVAIDVFNLDFLKSDCAEQIPAKVREYRGLLALASLVVIAFAPVCEELFFRGFVFPGLTKRWGLVAGIIVSGLLFSSAHLSYKSFVPIAGVGMIFAFTYWKSRNIFSTMMAHMAFNSLSIAFIAAGSCDSPSSSSGSVWATHLLTIVARGWL